MREVLEIKCPLCACTQGEIVIWGEDLLFRLPGHFAVLRCKQCSLYQTWPAMSTEELMEYYPESYYGEIPKPEIIKWCAYFHGMGRWLYNRIKNGGKVSNMALFLRPSWITLVLPISRQPGKLLDVGAGWGRFLVGALGMGWQAEALDISPTVMNIGTMSLPDA